MDKGPEKISIEQSIEGDKKEQTKVMSPKDFEYLKKFVKETYENRGPNPELIEKFNEHNETVLGYARDLASQEKLTPLESAILETAVILHDVSKFDVPLIKHGWESAKIAEEKLEQMGKDKEFIEAVKSAIERHMGPIPGFMANEAKKWEEKTGQKIEFPRPETKVDQILYDADMLCLIDRKGIEKILQLRKDIEQFIKEDKETAEKEGISQAEAAFQSALNSAHQAAESLYTESAKKKAKQLLEEVKSYHGT